jgi:NhaP-type Na+/H+ and K+/H+ antiporter
VKTKSTWLIYAKCLALNLPFKERALPYLRIALLFGLAFLLNAVAPDVLSRFQAMAETESLLATSLWCVGLIFFFGWAASEAAESTLLPNFAIQLLLGIVLHDAFAPMAAEPAVCVVLCTAMAAIILKSGGDAIELKAFKQIAWPSALIACVGYLITFFVMFAVLQALGIGSTLAALVAAIVGSTDPAALIPTLQRLTLKDQYQRVSDLAIAESAINDALGAIFTAATCALIVAGASLDDSIDLAKGLLNPTTLALLANEIGFGLLAGVAGWACMQTLERYQLRKFHLDIPDGAHAVAILIAIPLLTFVLAQMIHGNGFLAVFVSGLLANFTHKDPAFQPVLQRLDFKIESIAKPAIFMMVGPFVSLNQLVDTAGLGFVASCVLIFLARPIAVWVSLLPTNISAAEKLFLCAVRETGVIPVVLAVIVAAQFPQTVLLLPVVAWVVIWTLVLLPAITPWWTRKLQMNR